MTNRHWSYELFEWLEAVVVAEATYIICVFGLLIASGCSAAGDGSSIARLTLQVPASFTPDQVAATADARDQWCSANGWCPAIVEGAAGEHIVVVSDAEEPGPGEAAVGAHTDVEDHEIEVHQWTLNETPDMFWLIIAHEMGHLQGVEHHGGPECTMYYEHSTPEYQLQCE